MTEIENTSMTSENEAIIAYVEKHAGVTIERLQEDAGIPVAIVPKGWRLESVKPMIDAFNPYPERKSGFVEISDDGSFLDHLNRFRDNDETVIFVDRDDENPTITAIYNYHKPFEKGDDLEGARHCDHRAIYRFPVSKEWQSWIIGFANDEWWGQQALAEFLEENITDLRDPDALAPNVRDAMTASGLHIATPSAVMGVSQKLAITIECHVSESRRLASGEAQIVYQETHRSADDPTQPVRVPSAFAIEIPVFDRGDVFVIPVRLRYRTHAGKAMFKLLPYRPHIYFNEAVESVVERIRSEADCPLYFGTAPGFR